MNTDLVKISKKMSYALRHRPDAAGITLDPHGWVAVSDLLTALRIDRATLDAVVEGNDKRRFAVDGDRIRASQGHSVPVDLGYAPAAPPDALYHGTAAENVPSIRRDGLKKGRRHHVHLSVDTATAFAVGRRRNPAEVAILRVDALAMTASGYEFYVSANGVWLTDAVPPAFIASA
jgi:putative RNA 2'-phosphotransferase